MTLLLQSMFNILNVLPHGHHEFFYPILDLSENGQFVRLVVKEYHSVDYAFTLIPRYYDLWDYISCYSILLYLASHELLRNGKKIMFV